MSKNQYNVVRGVDRLLVGYNGVVISSAEVCDILNRQAETIEVMSEWLKDPNIEMRIMVDSARYWATQDENREDWDKNQKSHIVKSRRRIAALDACIDRSVEKSR